MLLHPHKTMQILSASVPLPQFPAFGLPHTMHQKTFYNSSFRLLFSLKASARRHPLAAENEPELPL